MSSPWMWAFSVLDENISILESALALASRRGYRLAAYMATVEEGIKAGKECLALVMALENANKELETFKKVIDAEKLRILGKEYEKYREDDSPKGENVPGVRYKIGTIMNGNRHCPDCGEKLHRVTRPSDSYLNADQFTSVKAGDWYCTECRSDIAATGYRYFRDGDIKREARS